MTEADGVDATWTDRFATTNYKGPTPYPVPCDWVLVVVEAGDIVWYRYPGIGEGLQHDNHVWEALDEEQDAVEDTREETAWLASDLVDFHWLGPDAESHEHALEIGGQTVFRRVDPGRDALMRAVAEALARYSNGQDLGGVAPTSGELPPDLHRERDIEQRAERNRQLTDYGTRGGES